MGITLCDRSTYPTADWAAFCFGFVVTYFLQMDSKFSIYTFRWIANSQWTHIQNPVNIPLYPTTMKTHRYQRLKEAQKKKSSETIVYPVRSELLRILVGRSRCSCWCRRSRHHRSDTGCWRTRWYLSTQKHEKIGLFRH